MTKEDLRNGSIVETRNEEKFIKIDGKLYSLENGAYWEISCYKDNLKHYNCSGEDIMKVCQNSISDNIRHHLINKKELTFRDEWTWIRDEDTELKEMTVSEIEEALGITGLRIKKED